VSVPDLIVTSKCFKDIDLGSSLWFFLSLFPKHFYAFFSVLAPSLPRF